MKRTARSNLLLEIPVTADGIVVLEQALFFGIPVHATLLFAREHCVAVARAYMRAVERRLAAGLDPALACIASQVISGWNVAADGPAPDTLHNRLGIAVAMRSAAAWHALLESPRWQRLAEAGAVLPRLLWDDAGARHPAATLLIETLSAVGTIDAVPVTALLNCRDLANRGVPSRVDEEAVDHMPAGFWGGAIDAAAQFARAERDRVVACSVAWGEMLARKQREVLPPGRRCAAHGLP